MGSLSYGTRTFLNDPSLYSMPRFVTFDPSSCKFFTYSVQSDVLSVAFSPFHPNLIFGGTYSGQILLWDTRAKHLPTLKSPLSFGGHTHPVYTVQVVGTQNAHNLVTSSTDGVVCTWLVDMLARPQVNNTPCSQQTANDSCLFDI